MQRLALVALAILLTPAMVCAQEAPERVDGGTAPEGEPSPPAADPPAGEPPSTDPASTEPVSGESPGHDESAPLEGGEGELPSALPIRIETEASAEAHELADPGATTEDAAIAFEPLPPEEPLLAVPAAPRLVGPSARDVLGDRAAAWIEAGLTVGGPADQSIVAFSPEVGLRFRVTRELIADASWGLSIASTDVAGTGTIGGEPVPYEAGLLRVDPGNPVLRGLYSGWVRPDLRLEAGFAVGIPAAARAEVGADADGLAQRASSELSNRASAAMRGYWSPWRWAPERFSIAVPLRVALALSEITVDAELGLGLMFPVLGDRGVDVDVVVQVAAGIGATVAAPLSLGVHVRGVAGALGVMVPGVVLSAEPWLGLDLDPVRLGLRGTVNLTSDDGVAGPRGPAVGLFVTAGVEL